MKKLLLLLFFIPLVNCSDGEEIIDNVPETTDDTNPVYLDTNGVTIKAKDWAVLGDSGSINGITYTIVDHQTLEDNTVTIRDRDTMEQERVAIDQIEAILKDKFDVRKALS